MNSQRKFFRSRELDAPWLDYCIMQLREERQFSIIIEW